MISKINFLCNPKRTTRNLIEILKVIDDLFSENNYCTFVINTTSSVVGFERLNTKNVFKYDSDNNITIYTNRNDVQIDIIQSADINEISILKYTHRGYKLKRIIIQLDYVHYNIYLCNSENFTPFYFKAVPYEQNMRGLECEMHYKRFI